MRHHPTRGRPQILVAGTDLFLPRALLAPGSSRRLGIGRPGPAGRLSPQRGGKFSMTFPNSSEGQLRETQAGGLGEREDVDHQ